MLIVDGITRISRGIERGSSKVAATPLSSSKDRAEKDRREDAGKKRGKDTHVSRKYFLRVKASGSA